MVNSVNTNNPAMIALQNLNKTNSLLERTQLSVSTGLRVNTAKDDAASYAISQRMRGDVAGYQSVKIALGLGDATLGVAIKAGEAINELLIEMKAKVVQAQADGLDTASRQALHDDFTALRNQLDTIVSTASFNGANLINNDTNTKSLSVLSSVDGTSKITILATALDKTTLGLAALDLTTTSGASTALASVNVAVNSVSSKLAALGSGAKQIEVQSQFTNELIDILKKGVGILVDADMAEESAKLQALQIKQQLGVQSLSIANSAPQALLSLFG